MSSSGLLVAGQFQSLAGPIRLWPHDYAALASNPRTGSRVRYKRCAAVHGVQTDGRGDPISRPIDDVLDHRSNRNWLMQGGKGTALSNIRMIHHLSEDNHSQQAAVKVWTSEIRTRIAIRKRNNIAIG
ncbi:hypothetical protein L226DRAFT_324760 [Lentinus tigrinus ALCF2SS1-7]|uniref:Uncharacterized protein n=1 Tax=Lentinus tigrinus ALCF2SS1-6 TaxID=1328759 RepID=A0A5C2SFZ9_9APHY|nr:hypothetical protein L227DRAFT_434018 [Lentinus tigrinus ALCF2SS1-6]RPD77523.1 hypothetical protein L226DRAFT_324760 [Lentinus tigrinus ALCF2SS1-7]